MVWVTLLGQPIELKNWFEPHKGKLTVRNDSCSQHKVLQIVSWTSEFDLSMCVSIEYLTPFQIYRDSRLGTHDGHTQFVLEHEILSVK